MWFHEHERHHPILEYVEIAELLRFTPDAFEARIVEAWRAFAEPARGGTVRIVEGSLFQIPIGVMLAMNAPAARIRALVRRLDALIAGAGGVLVYLHRPDVKRALAGTGDIRGMRWLEEMTGALAQSPYGRARRVRALSGLIAYYERQRGLVDRLMPRLDVRHTAIDVTRGAWDRYDRAITGFLDMRRAPEPKMTQAGLLRHAGVYRGTRRRQPAAVTTDGTRLYLQLPATSVLPLVRVAGGHFCPQGLPIDVRFAYGAGGRARGFRYESRMSNEQLAETAWVRA